MKKQMNLLKYVCLVVFILTWISCELDYPKSDNFDVSISENNMVPGGEIAYKTDKNDFALKFSPSLYGMKSEMNVTVNPGIWMGEHEVTYSLWEEVYDWAQENGYNIFSSGQAGSQSDFSDDHPVTRICWCDALVWSNALTEYYNQNNGQKPDYSFAYTYKGDPIRNSDINNEEFDNLDYDLLATGFRIPTNQDWHTAASFKNTPDNYASGANNDFDNEKANEIVAWYRTNSEEETHPVGEKISNSLDLYDMSGNVSEIVYDQLDKYGGKQNNRGGAWNSNASMLAVGSSFPIARNTNSISMGFRLARTLGDDDHKDIEKEEDKEEEEGPGDGEGYFSIGGIKYDIDKGLLLNFNTVNMELLTIVLFSEGIDREPDNNGGYTGTGHKMNIDLYISDDHLIHNKTYTEDKQMILLDAMMNLNTDKFPWEPENGFIGHANITLSVEIDDDEYTLVFSCTGSDYSGESGMSFSGEYKGTLTKLNAGIDF
ncbi:MAG: SUMF1/EgtB/PvdO family nonheme iron enzyme [Bacteroidota bacterium]|nr:SUMF1/EgtB/PvdO family nonheme iron enzyme [Bacteroidota bacterium]